MRVNIKRQTKIHRHNHPYVRLSVSLCVFVVIAHLGCVVYGSFHQVVSIVTSVNVPSIILDYDS